MMIEAMEPLTEEQVEEFRREWSLRWAMPGRYERVLVLGEHQLKSLKANWLPTSVKEWLAQSARLALGAEK